MYLTNILHLSQTNKHSRTEWVLFFSRVKRFVVLVDNEVWRAHEQSASVSWFGTGAHTGDRPQGAAKLTPKSSNFKLFFLNYSPSKETSLNSTSLSRLYTAFYLLPLYHGSWSRDSPSRRHEWPSAPHILVMLALCTRRTSNWTTSDIGGLNSGSDCRQKVEEQAGSEVCKRWKKKKTGAFGEQRRSWCGGDRLITDHGGLTWTQSAIASAKRESDFEGYSPWSAGSTIWSKASMSCSWGVAHPTSDCSDRGRDLQMFRQQGAIQFSSVQFRGLCNSARFENLRKIEEKWWWCSVCVFTCQKVSGQSGALAWQHRSCTRHSSRSTGQTWSPQGPCILSPHLTPEIVVM